MKKKCLSLLMTLVLLLCAAAPLSAVAEEETPTPFGLNYTKCDVNFSISQYGMANIKLSVKGIAGRVSRIESYTYLDRWEATANGLKWVKKYGPLKYTSTYTNLDKTWEQDLPINGDWRVQVQFVIYGNYPAEDETLTRYATYTV